MKKLICLIIMIFSLISLHSQDYIIEHANGLVSSLKREYEQKYGTLKFKHINIKYMDLKDKLMRVSYDSLNPQSISLFINNKWKKLDVNDPSIRNDFDRSICHEFAHIIQYSIKLPKAQEDHHGKLFYESTRIVYDLEKQMIYEIILNYDWDTDKIILDSRCITVICSK